MEVRFKKKSEIFDVVVTAVAAILSVGIMLFGVWHFGLRETWPELVLNLFYIASIVMMWLFFFNRLKPHQFNYGCSLCVGVTVLLRDILFPPPLASASSRLSGYKTSQVPVVSVTRPRPDRSPYSGLTRGSVISKPFAQTWPILRRPAIPSMGSRLT